MKSGLIYFNEQFQLQLELINKIGIEVYPGHWKYLVRNTRREFTPKKDSVCFVSMVLS